MSRYARVAYHEAGHAVVAHALGQVVEGAWVCPDRGAMCFTELPDAADRRGLRRLAAILAAGEAAEAMAEDVAPAVTGPTPGGPTRERFTADAAGRRPAEAPFPVAYLAAEPGGPECPADYAQLADAVGDRAAPVCGPGRTVHDWYRVGRGIASRILRRRMPAFLAVAAELQRHRVIGRERFLAIVDGAA